MRVIVADSLQKCNLAGDNSINAIPRIVGAVVDTDIYTYIGLGGCKVGTQIMVPRQKVARSMVIMGI